MIDDHKTFHISRSKLAARHTATFPYVPSPIQHLRDGGGAERALPFAANPHDGAVGEAGVHPHPVQAPRHAQAAVPDGQAPVGRRQRDARGSKRD